MPDFLYTGPTKVVLAFDVGTTYSGISYCIFQPGHAPKVLAVTRFPAQGVGRADNKVPSVLYYDKSGSLRAAGAGVLKQDVIETAHKEGWTKAEYWKLHLRPKHLTSCIDDLVLLPLGKSVIDVLTDFIKYLFDCCKAYIQECHGTSTWSSVEHSIEYVLTYPGGWDQQRYLYCQAIERAGLVPCTRGDHPRIYMLTEGEATLHSYVSRVSSSNTANQKDPEGVVIIDAGGGLIGLSMFSTTSNPISCKEIAPAECRLQGSIFVTSRARALMERKLEGLQHPSAKDMEECSREFDQTVKLVIESDREPVYIKVADRRTHSPKHCILSGQLKLSGEEATKLFNDSVNAIIDTFEQQQKATAVPITTAFLVGGLSANDWVRSRLQSYFASKKIKIHRLDNHIKKVVAKGAVLSHINRIHHDNYSNVACVTNSAGHAQLVNPVDEEHDRRKTTLRGYLRGFFARALVLAKRWNERNPLDFGIQAVHRVCHRGGLSDPKRVVQDQCKWLIRSSLFIHRSIPMDFGGNVKEIGSQPGIPVPHPKRGEQRPGIEKNLDPRTSPSRQFQGRRALLTPCLMVGLPKSPASTTLT